MIYKVGVRHEVTAGIPKFPVFGPTIFRDLLHLSSTVLDGRVQLACNQ